MDSKDIKTGTQKSESERQMADGGKTTETKSEIVDSQKSSSTTNNKTVDETTTTTKSIVIKADVHSGSIAQEESVSTAAAPAENANATEPPAPSADAGAKVETKEVVQSKSEGGEGASDEKKSATDEKVSIETTAVQEQAATATQSAPPPPSPQPPPTASSSPNKTDASQEKKDDAKPAETAAPKEENAKKLTIESIAATKLAASAAAAASKPSQDTAAVAAGDGSQAKQSETATKTETDKKAEDTSASKDQAESQSQATGNAVSSAAASAAATESGAATADVKTDEKNPNVDASESFQVLPKDKQQQQQQQTSDNLNQEKDDTGNLAPPNPPTGEPIRKTSFTVLKSDESIDDVMAGLNGNADDDGQGDGGSHAKSFKVLKAHGASGEDIILQQSSDQETGGNENYEDYMTRNLASYSGKYSDSELIAGQLNGRRKKYKKRAKSVKQLTIVDGLSKDQDSGFEPSPRTVRASSQRAATTRAIYTANLPERPRVGDIIDCRSASTRFEPGRKPGDKNAVNMSTVQATLQRNIRRYVFRYVFIRPK